MDPQNYQFVRIAVTQKQAENRVSDEDRERLEVDRAEEKIREAIHLSAVQRVMFSEIC
jgi:hypothetical protein